jgi:hypothetical protein
VTLWHIHAGPDDRSGLVSAACFADFGHCVICMDSDAAKFDALNRGEIPIYEPELDDLMARNLAAGRIGCSPAKAESCDAAVDPGRSAQHLSRAGGAASGVHLCWRGAWRHRLNVED